MTEPIKPRVEIAEALKWDLRHLFATNDEFQDTLAAYPSQVSAFVTSYKGQLTDATTIVEAIKAFEALTTTASHLGQYSYLPVSVDILDSQAQQLARRVGNILAQEDAKTSFFFSELTALPVEVLDEVTTLSPAHSAFIRRIKRTKKAQLAPEVEETLAHLSPVLEAQADIFEQARSADADFGTFDVDRVTYPLDFVTYEEVYMYHENPKVRRAAYDQFNRVLRQYENVIATAYYTQVQKEKTLATLRGYDSVFDYLLDGQEVSRALYDRQIDVIMAEFAPVMRKYITHIKEQNSLEKMTYADLKIDLDADYTQAVTISESQQLAREAFAPLGEDYVNMIDDAWSQRWVDFARNKGKRSGAFCSTTYGKHAYIMLTWNDQLSDAYTLFHELGHAGQGMLAWQHNPQLSARPSLYLIEGPSTFNELLLTDYLQQNAKNPRQERAALAMMISKTYFHNFITHLLEAAYQREVYRLIDAGQSFDANKLSSLKREVLESFWGDAVEIEPGAELTWMRQIHYYMGLYPYTYSAGLTIATQAFLQIKQGKQDMSGWLEFLALGNQKVPEEATQVAGVDVTTDEPLTATIQYLDETVDRIIALSQQIDAVANN